MRLERLNYDKIKIFLTFDDLSERGITKEEMWQDIPKVHQLFRDMMLEASDELGFEADGPIAIEVFSLPAQGMVIIVTKSKKDDETEEEFDDGYIEMQVTLDESEEIIYEFSSIEDVIELAPRLISFGVTSGSLLHFENNYILTFDERDLFGIDMDAFIALLSEYGNPSTITIFRLIEYGNEIIEKNAIEKIYHTFHN
ncbi:genetic competence negative regulator [Anaerobacillus alkaliphilus]|uniref:Adapter protein MecA n=1 Tax=Anaerobacillus alkaliphilus TaxID=1548597 RepID=A0A4V1LGU1_9BACI|nr:genetic competence negative regulator [Anaerobacillus alkaliphilus]RXJ03915.1 genetic competence negative regulator [Anaerobacillus alkaliphilus]